MSLAKWIGFGGGAQSGSGAAAPKGAADASPAELAKISALTKGECKRFGLENVRLPLSLSLCSFLAIAVSWSLTNASCGTVVW